MRAIVLALFAAAIAAPACAQNARHFTFHYELTVRGIDAGKTLQVWFPMASTDRYQSINIVKVTSDLALKRTRETKYGDAMFYASAPKSDKAEYNFAVDYDVVRYERVTLSAAERQASEDTSAPQARVKPAKLDPSVRMYLLPDKLVPTSGLPAQLAEKTVEGRTDELQKARAIYDYVLANMRYDKSGTGWGRGDTMWACDAKRGNCTDFHALFMSMARSQGIPAKFEIGFPIPAAKHEGEIPGYHCWAEFYEQSKGWVPVDISEAWKDPSKREYYFGSYDDNRVQFSAGRDVVLNPKQAGEPLNYFVYPYVEVDGKKYENVLTKFAFADVQGDPAGAQRAASGK